MLAPAETLRGFGPLIDALWSNGTLFRSAGNWQDARRFFERAAESPPVPTRMNADLAVLNHQVGDLVQGSANIEVLLENPAPGAA